MNKQPKALKVLFFTEMWERYGFYTVQAILVFYMIKKFSLSDTQAYSVLGQFLALGYIVPVVGGWVADRFLGSRMAVLLGCLNLCLGYALLAFEHTMLYVGLSFVIIGNGLLKPNVSTFLGRFYTYHDERQEAGFTLFYIGINVGSLLATLSVGYIQKFLGWNACFAGASIALVLGIAYFLWGYRYFEDKGLPPTIKVHTLYGLLKKNPAFMVVFFMLLTLIYYALTLTNAGSYGLYICGVIFFSYVIKISWEMSMQDRNRMVAIILLFFMTAVFFAVFLQMYFTVNVFTERLVDRSIAGYEIPTAVFLSLESAFLLIVGPFFARLWRSGKVPLSISAKFIAGLICVSVAMQMLSWLTVGSENVLSGSWLIVFYLFYAISDLLILPVGFSMIVEYVPQQYTGMMMGGFFMTIGFSGKLAGFLASFAEVPKEVTDLHALNMIYQHAFQYYAWLGFSMAFIFIMIKPFIQRLLNAHD